jgi:hypothetical protein
MSDMFIGFLVWCMDMERVPTTHLSRKNRIGHWPCQDCIHSRNNTKGQVRGREARTVHGPTCTLEPPFRNQEW